MRSFCSLPQRKHKFIRFVNILKEKRMGMRVSVCLHPFPSSGEMQPLSNVSTLISLSCEAVSRVTQASLELILLPPLPE